MPQFIHLSSWRQSIIILTALSIGLLASFGAVQSLKSKAEADSRAKMNDALELMVLDLNTKTIRSQPMGAAILLGINEPILKDAANGKLPPDAPEILARLKSPHQHFGADGLYVINREGLIVAHETTGKSSTGNSIAFRPYFQRAIRGQNNVYAAVGSYSGERGLYFAAPLYETTAPQSPVIGAIVIKMPGEPLDKQLSQLGGSAFLLSPQGIVFASTRGNWLFAMTPPSSLERVAEIHNLKQFGKRFESSQPDLLPFDPNAKEVELSGQHYALESKSLEWNDPGGEWKVFNMREVDSLFPLKHKIQVISVVILIALMMGILLAFVDTYRRKIAKDLLRFRILGTVQESSPIAVIIADPAGRIEWVNPQYERNTGYELTEVKGKYPAEVVGTALPSNEKLPQNSTDTSSNLWTSLASQQQWRGEFINHRKDGSTYWDDAIITPVKDDKQHIIGYVGMLEDVTLRKNMEERLRELAHFDKLTGLPNRALFLDRLQQAAARSKRERTRFALLFVDLDGFKAVNDGYGHDTGDALLQIVAQRLNECVRESDTVARMGGDEFTIILLNMLDARNASPIAEKIIASLSQPVVIGEHVCHIGGSIGISVFPDDGDDVSTVLSHADSAMYEVKRRGKNSFRYFSDL